MGPPLIHQKPGYRGTNSSHRTTHPNVADAPHRATLPLPHSGTKALAAGASDESAQRAPSPLHRDQRPRQPAVGTGTRAPAASPARGRIARNPLGPRTGGACSPLGASPQHPGWLGPPLRASAGPHMRATCWRLQVPATACVAQRSGSHGRRLLLLWQLDVSPASPALHKRACPARTRRPAGAGSLLQDTEPSPWLCPQRAPRPLRQAPRRAFSWSRVCWGAGSLRTHSWRARPAPGMKRTPATCSLGSGTLLLSLGDRQGAPKPPRWGGRGTGRTSGGQRRVLLSLSSCGETEAGDQAPVRHERLPALLRAAGHVKSLCIRIT